MRKGSFLTASRSGSLYDAPATTDRTGATPCGRGGSLDRRRADSGDLAADGPKANCLPRAEARERRWQQSWSSQRRPKISPCAGRPSSD